MRLDVAGAFERALEWRRRRAAEIEYAIEWIYPNRRLEALLGGRLVLAVTLSIGFAAINTGHNLFYLILGMLASLMLGSGVLSERVLRGLEAERRLPSDCFAGTPAVVEVLLTNRKRSRASYAVAVSDEIVGMGRRVIGRVGRLDPGASVAFHAIWTPPRRGRYRFGRIYLATAFPFEVFRKSRFLPLPDELVVFPSITRATSGVGGSASARLPRRVSREGEEWVGLREYRVEDDVRRIHWPATARTGEMIVREHGQPVDRPVLVFLDDRGPSGDRFERAVEMAATTLWEAAEAGVRFELSTHRQVIAGRGRGGLRALLTHLAEVQAQPTAPDATRFNRWRRRVEAGSGGVFIGTGEAVGVPQGAQVRVA